MTLDCLTITGADNQTPQQEILAMSDAFPILEWGLLLSPKSFGKSGYPDPSWIEYLAASSPHLRLSGHVCGIWLHEILQGKFPEALRRLPFRRLQLNLAKYLPQVTSRHLKKALPASNSYILQVGEYDTHGISLACELMDAGFDVAILSDVSGGAGVSPSEWKPFPEDIRVGYAGGLGPGNLTSGLKQIESIAGNRTIWIDMQSKIRTDDKRAIDFTKVKECLLAGNDYFTRGKDQ